MSSEKKLVEIYLETECEIRLDEIEKYPERLKEYRYQMAEALIRGLSEKDFEALFKFKTIDPYNDKKSAFDISDRMRDNLLMRRTMLLRAGIKTSNHE